MKFRIHNFEQLSSTLDEAADTKYSHCDVITARFQSAGRGQRGNKWVSVEGLNLMTTIVVEPTHIRVTEQFTVSMITALAVAATVRSFGVDGVCVKWPNDIYVGQEKIAGILIEHSFSSEMLARSLLGVGINVRQVDFEQGAGRPTSLHILGVESATIEEVLRRLCEKFEHFYHLSISDLHQQYISQLYRRDGYHQFSDSEGEFRARISAIDPRSGVITLTDTDDRSREYYFKEVAYSSDNA